MFFLIADAAPANIWNALPSLLWIALAATALFVFRGQLSWLLENLSWRMKSGAAVKLFSLELGQGYVAPDIDPSKDEKSTAHYVDTAERRYQQRKSYYEPNRNIHLVHRIAPSKVPGMLYDIQLYLIPHKEASLASVAKVEYYFGKHWGNAVFICTDRARNFAITTSAFGPFMCTAELFFTDEQRVITNRYVDFEMGGIGSKV
jgi:hypothetical protein